ncbi:conserved hypothetical protein [Rippkaea orientalis PCC 8801]|uniref:DUF29 domain-containing protein n=1 Tax=Rippkaea orientalis (strain PCC 8801 / RF-1) TaxID=41431 RepID=B7K109_RIPO1|nr:DUF29 family protein [Rippkaea orientalis]ACK65150.1 conserved hypothetical protein [Rippkaea orientalis PCC 8801]
MTVQPLSWQKLYETEYDQWLAATVSCLKTRQLEQLDFDNLIEELKEWFPPV